MERMSAQALRTAVVQAASSDMAFRKELINKGASAVNTRFGDQGLDVRVCIEGEQELAILIPDKDQRTSEAVERIARQVGNRGPTRSEFEALVIHRAWTDAVFLAQLRANARGAINSALETYKFSVPSQATVRLYEELPGECLILVPPLPSDMRELSDGELGEVAGGRKPEISNPISGAIAGAITGPIVGTVR